MKNPLSIPASTLRPLFVYFLAARVQKLFDHIAAGRIAVYGGYVNMHSSKLGYEEVNRFLYPAHRIENAYMNILRSDEHSIPGAGWPGKLTKADVDESNRFKFMDAAEAYNATTALLDESLETFGKKIGITKPGILDYNAFSWERSDIITVEIPPGIYGKPLIIRDGVTQKEIAYQKIGDNTIAFIAPDLPSLGYKIFYGEKVSTPPDYPDRVQVTANGQTIENDFHVVSISPHGLSIIDKQFGRELVNGASPFTFNGLIRADNIEDLLGIYSKVEIGEVTLAGSSGPIRGEMVLGLKTSPARTTESHQAASTTASPARGSAGDDTRSPSPMAADSIRLATLCV